jgi:potassium efflux system protein
VKNTYKIAGLSAIFLLICGAGLIHYLTTTEHIHIALIAETSGDKSIVQAAMLYVDEINQQGGIHGQKVVLDVFDDQNDPNIAQQKAVEIAEQNNAIAVIGHRSSSCSISAGDIYKKYHIPAITPFSTNVKVTQDNDWYFRTIFDDRLQGRFLAHYVKNVFQQKTASIIYTDDAYGSYLAQVFSETASDLDIQIKHQWHFKNNDPSVDQTLSQIAGELKANAAQAGAVFWRLMSRLESNWLN